MRSIGCHRLRDNLNYKYGYWNSEKNKCEYGVDDSSSSGQFNTTAFQIFLYL